MAQRDARPTEPLGWRADIHIAPTPVDVDPSRLIADGGYQTNSDAASARRERLSTLTKRVIMTDALSCFGSSRSVQRQPTHASLCRRLKTRPARAHSHGLHHDDQPRAVGDDDSVGVLRSPQVVIDITPAPRPEAPTPNSPGRGMVNGHNFTISTRVVRAYRCPPSSTIERAGAPASLVRA